VDPDTHRLEEDEVNAELAAYETARDRAAADLRALQTKVETQVGRKEAAIFAVHEAILQEADFTLKVRAWIVDERLTAAAALQKLMQHYTSLFAHTRDEYLKDRLNDVRDVVVRLGSNLGQIQRPASHALDGPVIVVADELLPSQAVALGDISVRGIVTQAGSRTSHAAIIARSRGIPAVSGVTGILRHVKTGDMIVVDGREGHVIVHPDAETQSAYRKLEREFFHLQDHLAENRDRQPEMADGITLELMANINGLDDARAAVAMGASAVGLFRTEYIYLTHPSIPDEEEQYTTYCDIVDASPGRNVTIRTLDIGGDKTIAYLGHRQREANPFMGWRSIRLSFEHPELFSAQIRAILRCAAYAQKRGGAVRLMFPMITTLEEVHRLRHMVRRAGEHLRRRGKSFGDVSIGMMLEVPAAAVSLRNMLPAVDFVSIGSNDLVQYLMAADRDNPKVSHLCQPTAPAVLRVLADVMAACRDARKPVTLCGEMAGQPRSFVLLVGLGLRSFSMSPALIPSIKELTGHLTVELAEGIAAHALRLKTISKVGRYLGDQLQQISPDLKMLDTK
jgi:phosphotransferase system enzyme I (PtsI)